MRYGAQKFLNWKLVVAVCYFVVLLLEIKFVFPVERALLADYKDIVSLLFLPHAVRVLSTVIVGPKVFFVLFPTILFSGYFLFESYGGVISTPLIIDAATGASCAPIAYLAVKWAYRNSTNFKLTLMNWRMVFLIGAVASLLNSVMRVTLLGGIKTHDEIQQQVISVLIGDMTGLLVGLVVLVFSFRLARRGQI